MCMCGLCKFYRITTVNQSELWYCTDINFLQYGYSGSAATPRSLGMTCCDIALHALYIVLSGPRHAADKCEMESTSSSSIESRTPRLNLSAVGYRPLHRYSMLCSVLILRRNR
jgi:hypothetical protein